MVAWRVNLRIVDRFIRQRPDDTIYHYTNASGLIGILKTRAIWATSHLHLNDGLEFEIAAKLFREELEHSSLTEKQHQVFWELIKQMQEPRFILSFSQHRDRLSQWRAYCTGGDGYALGFSAENPIFESAQQKSFNRKRPSNITF
jgi:hypothetical protein